MVTRQPSVAVAFTTTMPRPNKLRNLVSRYLAKPRRKRLTREFAPVDIPQLPPPPPPKDVSASVFSSADDVDAGVRHEYITHSIFLAQDMSRLSWAQPLQPPQRMQQQRRPPSTKPFPKIPKHTNLPQMLSPAEIRLRREEASRAYEQQELSNADQEEAERLYRLRIEKEALERQLRMEEEQRKLTLEEDLRLAAILRRQKEERERREEEERHQKIEARREADRERRIRQAQKMQEWREEQARQAEEVLRRKAEMRMHVHEDRKMRSLTSESSVMGDESIEDSFHCWVTVQKNDSLTWRRRFCRIQHTHLVMYKNTTSAQPMESIDISSARAVHERADDHEELEGLANAFALDVKRELSYILFTDNDNDKETLVSLIVQVAGI